MICRYCQQECQPIQKGPLPNGLYENRIAHCNVCNVGYFDRFHCLYTTLNGKSYSVTYMDDHPGHWTSVYQHHAPYRPGSAHSDRIILSFKFHVKFTPTNFKDKLKLYLLFS